MTLINSLEFYKAKSSLNDLRAKLYQERANIFEEMYYDMLKDINKFKENELINLKQIKTLKIYVEMLENSIGGGHYAE